MLFHYNDDHFTEQLQLKAETGEPGPYPNSALPKPPEHPLYVHDIDPGPIPIDANENEAPTPTNSSTLLAEHITGPAEIVAP